MVKQIMLLTWALSSINIVDVNFSISIFIII